MTWRQFLAWQAWLDLRTEHPSLDDQYAMQTAAEVTNIPARLFGGELKQPSDMRLRFKEQTVTRKPAGKRGFGPRIATKEDIAKVNVAMLGHKLRGGR